MELQNACYPVPRKRYWSSKRKSHIYAFIWIQTSNINERTNEKKNWNRRNTFNFEQLQDTEWRIINVMKILKKNK
jgi:hypothetical protein